MLGLRVKSVIDAYLCGWNIPADRPGCLLRCEPFQELEHL